MGITYWGDLMRADAFAMAASNPASTAASRSICQRRASSTSCSEIRKVIRRRVDF
jgi:hypothetical protein